MDSQEYQITHTWLERMAEYKTLDHVLPAQDFEHALHQLLQMTKRALYQPQSPEVSVQILGVLEAIDLPFDYLWVMNFDDRTWPPAPKPNAFIPRQLQKTLNLPHATAEREFTYCQQLTEKLTQAAPQIIFSHAIKDEEIDLRSSPLIESIPTLDLSLLAHSSSPLALAFSPYHSIPQRVYTHKETESYTDEQGPPVTHSEKIHGGITILKKQAACPFKAFSELRLHASVLDAPISGLRPQERGTVIHKALELIWKKLRDQHALIALDDASLQTLIQQQVDSAISHVTGQSNLASRYLQLESARVQKLLWEWLQLEKTRPPFTVIATEYAQQIQLGELTLNVRVDRIDEIGRGKKLIIDYKTGKTQQISHWFGNRPEEPQLPVYCLINPTDTIGIAFAQIYPGELQLKGVSKMGLEMKSIKTLPEVDTTPNTLWEQQLIEWQAVLYKLSLDFQQGQANVDPKDKEQTCRLCHLQSLCRIYSENAP